MGSDEPPPLETPSVLRARGYGLSRFGDVIADLGAGRGFAAFKRLLALRRTPLSAADRQAVDAALADQRLFVEPTKKPPSLGRFNGLGTGMYGSNAHDPSDGSYVKTRFVSAFWIPVFPLDQWLVKSADGGGWYFLGRVPLGLPMRRMRLFATCALAAIALAIVAATTWAHTHASLNVVNGLDVDATVSIDDDPAVTVPSRGRRTVELSSGRHAFRCSVGGRTIDQSTADVSGTADLVAYNVAGAAPLCVENILYTNEARRADAPKPRHTVSVLAGPVFVQQQDVDDVFAQPPATVSLSSSETQRVRRHAFVADGGWRRTVSILEGQSGSTQSPDVAEAVALAQPDDAKAVAECIEISKAGRSAKDHAAFLERLKAAKTPGPR